MGRGRKEDRRVDCWKLSLNVLVLFGAAKGLLQNTTSEARNRELSATGRERREQTREETGENRTTKDKSTRGIDRIRERVL